MDLTPKIIREQTFGDKVIGVVAWLLLLLLWVMSVWNYNSLPDTIPIHFGINGEPDNFGNKMSIFILPLLGTILFGLFSYRVKYPKKLNATAKFTEEKVNAMTIINQRMMMFLRASLLLFFVYLLRGILESVKGNASGLNIAKMMVPLAVIIFPAVYFNYKMRQIIK